MRKHISVKTFLAFLPFNFFLLVFAQNQAFTFNQTNTGFPINTVSTIAIDTAGDIWVGTPNNGVYYFAQNAWTPFTAATMLLPSDVIRDIEVDDQNNVWILTGVGLSRLTGTTFTNFQNPCLGGNGNDIEILGSDIFIGTSQGLRIFDGTNWDCIPSGTNHAIREIAIDDQDHVWAATASGLIEYLPPFYTTENGHNTNIPATNVQSIAIDSLGKKWVGFITENGIASYDGNTWFLDPRPCDIFQIGNATDRVTSIAVDEYGRVWSTVRDIQTPTNSGCVAARQLGNPGPFGLSTLAFRAGNVGFPTHDFSHIELGRGNGEVWVGTNGFGVSVMVANGVHKISGNVFYDQNQNGIKDGGDYGIPYQLAYVLGGHNYATSDFQGDYTLSLHDNGGTFNVTVGTPSYWSITSIPDVQTVVQQPVTNAINHTSGIDFGMYPSDNVSDVRVSLVGGFTRPGFIVPYWINYENVGTTIAGDTIIMDMDPKLSYINAAPAPFDTSGGQLKWVYSGLMPFQNGQIDLQLRLTPSATLTDSVHNTVTIYPIAIDNNPADNVASFHQEVRGSFDPNDKRAIPADTIPPAVIAAGKEIEYTIRFQNTGTDTAFNIRIFDSLSRKLQVHTFRPLGSSHPFTHRISGGGDLEFFFHNILLPDSNINEPLSHGFVKFGIMADTNLPAGTVIRNTAEIYFDYNAPIITNTTQNHVLDFFVTSRTVDLNPGKVTLYPNPVGNDRKLGVLNETGGGLHLILFDGLGRRWLEREELPIGSSELVLLDLKMGVYFCELRDERGKRRVVKVLVGE